MHNLALHSNHKAGITSLFEGKNLRIQQDVLVCVIDDRSLVVLQNRRRTVLLSDEAINVPGVVATIPLYFIAEECLRMLVGHSGTWS
jgi:hypothetical protein